MPKNQSGPKCPSCLGYGRKYMGKKLGMQPKWPITCKSCKASNDYMGYVESIETARERREKERLERDARLKRILGKN